MTWKRLIKPHSPPVLDMQQKYNYYVIFLDVCKDTYMYKGHHCLSPEAYRQADTYREVTLSDCHKVCEVLHDTSCSMVLYIQHTRECITQPLREFVSKYGNCSVKYSAEVYRRIRCLSEYEKFKWVNQESTFVDPILGS